MLRGSLYNLNWLVICILLRRHPGMSSTSQIVLFTVMFVKGGDGQAGLVPADQYHEEVNDGTGVQEAGGKCALQHAAEFRL